MHYRFLTKHTIIPEKQYAFREKYATHNIMALIDLVDNIYCNFDEKIPCRCISRYLEYFNPCSVSLEYRLKYTVTYG